MVGVCCFLRSRVDFSPCLAESLSGQFGISPGMLTFSEGGCPEQGEMLALQKWLLWEAVGCFIFAQSGKFHPQIRDLRRVGCDCLKNSPRTNVQKIVAPITQGPRSLCFSPLELFLLSSSICTHLTPGLESLEGIIAPGTISGMIYRESIYNVPFSFTHSFVSSFIIYLFIWAEFSFVKQNLLQDILVFLTTSGGKDADFLCFVHLKTL